MFFESKCFFAFNSKSARPDSQKNNSVQKKQFPFRNGPFRAILVHFGLILGQFGSKMFFSVQNVFLQKVYSPFTSARPDSQKNILNGKNILNEKCFFLNEKNNLARKTQTLFPELLYQIQVPGPGSGPGPGPGTRFSYSFRSRSRYKVQVRFQVPVQVQVQAQVQAQVQVLVRYPSPGQSSLGKVDTF